MKNQQLTEKKKYVSDKNGIYKKIEIFFILFFQVAVRDEVN